MIRLLKKCVVSPALDTVSIAVYYRAASEKGGLIAGLPGGGNGSAFHHLKGV